MEPIGSTRASQLPVWKSRVRVWVLGIAKLAYLLRLGATCLNLLRPPVCSMWECPQPRPPLLHLVPQQRRRPPIDGAAGPIRVWGSHVPCRIEPLHAAIAATPRSHSPAAGARWLATGFRWPGDRRLVAWRREERSVCGEDCPRGMSTLVTAFFYSVALDTARHESVWILAWWGGVRAGWEAWLPTSNCGHPLCCRCFISPWFY
jgi:hypothetical protein